MSNNSNLEDFLSFLTSYPSKMLELEELRSKYTDRNLAGENLKKFLSEDLIPFARKNGFDFTEDEYRKNLDTAIQRKRNLKIKRDLSRLLKVSALTGISSLAALAAYSTYQTLSNTPLRSAQSPLTTPPEPAPSEGLPSAASPSAPAPPTASSPKPVEKETPPAPLQKSAGGKGVPLAPPPGSRRGAASSPAQRTPAGGKGVPLAPPPGSRRGAASSPAQRTPAVGETPPPPPPSVPSLSRAVPLRLAPQRPAVGGAPPLSGEPPPLSVPPILSTPLPAPISPGPAISPSIPMGGTPPPAPISPGPAISPSIPMGGTPPPPPISPGPAISPSIPMGGTPPPPAPLPPRSTILSSLPPLPECTDLEGLNDRSFLYKIYQLDFSVIPKSSQLYRLIKQRVIKAYDTYKNNFPGSVDCDLRTISSNLYQRLFPDSQGLIP